MTKLWFNNDCVEISIATIRDFMNVYRHVPPSMVSAYKETLKTATHGQKILFFNLLHEKCPEAMEYFTDA